MNYWVYYYDELRSQLPNYTTDPESVPHHLRGHERLIQIWECWDGYGVLHYADPENVHNAETPERFELITDYQNETVGELVEDDAMMRRLTLHSEDPFWVTNTGVVLKNEPSGEYVTPSSWERRDLISNRRIEQWNAERWGAQTVEEAIEQAKEDLQQFFNRPSSP